MNPASYVRSVVRGGGLVAAADSPFVQTGVDMLELFTRQLGTRACCHLETTNSGQVVLVATSNTWGAHPWALQCLACWRAPTVADGCQVCLRTSAPLIRVVVSPAGRSTQDLVLVGIMCLNCRRGRV